MCLDRLSQLFWFAAVIFHPFQCIESISWFQLTLSDLGCLWSRDEAHYVVARRLVAQHEAGKCAWLSLMCFCNLASHQTDDRNQLHVDDKYLLHIEVLLLNLGI